MHKQLGGGNCSLCGSIGTNKSTCPLNPLAKIVRPEKHPLAKAQKADAAAAARPSPPIISVPPIRVQAKQKPELERISNACKGKYRKEGGLDNIELERITSSKGVQGTSVMPRKELLYHICPASTVPEANIKYLEIGTFLDQYPKGQIIGRGSWGSVYKSGDYAVKVFTDEESLTMASVELNIYSKFYHPCINRPVAWSHDSETDECYIAMPQGSSIENAYKTGLISIAQIVSDTLSAIAYMNSLGIAHHDIKPNNIIYHDGYAKIIDMGLAVEATLFSDTKWRTNGIAYTPQYKDPEYVEQVWNPISSETYAIAKTYYDILGHRYTFMNMYSFNANDPVMAGYPEVMHKEELNMLFEEAKKPANIRLTTYELLQILPESLITRRHVGQEVEPPAIPFNDYCRSTGSTWTLESDQVDYVYNRTISVIHRMPNDDDKPTARTLFACLNLINRAIDVIKDNIDQMELFGAACFKLTYNALQSVNINIGPEQEQVTKMMIDIIDRVNCVITAPTSWDYASCKEDLVPMLSDSMKCDYDPGYTRVLLNTGNSKNVSAFELINLWRRTADAYDIHRNMKSRIPYEELSNLQPVTEIAEVTPELFSELISNNIDHQNEQGFLAVLLLGKAKYTNLETALEIYGYAETLDDYWEGFVDIANRIFPFNISKYTSEELRSNGVHPFNTTQRELDSIFGNRP